MKKIMFDNHYGIESAVLYGRKTMTRRMIPPKFGEALNRIAKKCVWSIPLDSIPEGVSIEEVAEVFAKADGELFFQVKSKSEEIKVQMEDSDIQLLIQCAPYKIGEVVAIAQSYDTIMHDMPQDQRIAFRSKILEAHNKEYLRDVKGWFNKMFVRADLMPHQIQITDVKIERLQDITDEDCRKEGWIDNPYVFAYSFKLIK